MALSDQFPLSGYVTMNLPAAIGPGAMSGLLRMDVVPVDDKQAPRVIVSMRSADTTIWLSPGIHRIVGFRPQQPAPSTTHEAARAPTVVQAIHEIRYKTNLTWSQMAKALGVQPRSLHYWSEGRAASGRNAERLMEFVHEINKLDAGDPDATTRQLLAPREAEPSVFVEFCMRNAPPKRKLQSLGLDVDDDEIRRRLVFRPADLLDARHDSIGPMVGDYVDTVQTTDQTE